MSGAVLAAAGWLEGVSAQRDETREKQQMQGRIRHARRSTDDGEDDWDFTVFTAMHVHGD